MNLLFADRLKRAVSVKALVIAGALAVGIVPIVAGCSASGQLCGNLTCDEAWIGNATAALQQLTTQMEGLYQAINALSEATVPGLCSTAQSANAYYQQWASHGTTSVAENTDEATALAALNAVCSTGGNINVANLASVALQLYTIIDAAVNKTGHSLRHSAKALRLSLAHHPAFRRVQ